MIDDAPKNTITEDLLHRRGLVTRMVEHILRKRTPEECQRGEVIGLLGPWGSGKTTVLRFLEEAIGKASAAKATDPSLGTKQVWVNLWESEITGALLSVIVDELERQASPSTGGAGVKEVVGTLGRILRSTGAVAGCFNPLLGAAVQGMGELTELEERERSRQENLVSVKSQFRKLEELLLGVGTRRLVVYLDDLDRCSPAHMISVVEGVRNLLAGCRTTFVLGIDPEVFARALQWKYGSTFPRDEGILYLEKVLVPCFHLPTISPEDFLKSQFADSDIPNHQELAILGARNAMFCGISNPRMLKLSAHKLKVFWTSSANEAERASKMLGNRQMKKQPSDTPGTYVAAAILALIMLRQRHPSVYDRLQHASVRKYEYLRAAWEYWFARRTNQDGTIGKWYSHFTHVWGEEPGTLYCSGALHLLSVIHQRLCEAREGPATPEPSVPNSADKKQGAAPGEPDDGRFKADPGILGAACALFELQVP